MLEPCWLYQANVLFIASIADHDREDVGGSAGRGVKYVPIDPILLLDSKSEDAPMLSRTRAGDITPRLTFVTIRDADRHS